MIANGLFDYVDDAGLGLERAAHWSRGGLVATFPDRWAPRALPRRLWWRARGVRVHLFDRAEITALAAGAGLSHVRIDRIGPIHLLCGQSGYGKP